MICALCSQLISDDCTNDLRIIYVHATRYMLHKNCLRKASRKELVEKGLITPDESFWRNY